MTRSFSLGNALFENPIAPFLRTLARDYLDGPDRVAVALTCKASLEWFLQDWQTATLRLGVRPTGDELTERLLRRTQRAKQRLLLRGQHATTVQLKQQHSMTDSDVGWMVTLNALASTGKVSALGLTLQHLSAQNLTIVGQALPNLTTLTLSHPEALDGAFKLPPPCALPTLRHLKLQRIALIAQGCLWDSVGPFMAQLEGLNIIEHQDHGVDAATDPRRPIWHRVLAPAHTTQTLTSISLPAPLEPWLAKLIQQHTPRLEELTVTGIVAGTAGAGNVSAVCSWTTLRFSKEATVPASAWEWLPLPADGSKLVVDMAKSGKVNLHLPLEEQVSAKLPRLSLSGSITVTLYGEDTEAEDQAAALRNALPVIAPLQLSDADTTLELHKFTLTNPLAAELAAVTAAGWRQLSFTELTWPTDTDITTPLPPTITTLALAEPLTDARLAQLLQVGAACTIQQLRVPELKLTAAVAEGTRLPFEGVHLKQSVVTHVTTFLPQVEAGEHLVWAEKLSKLRIRSIDEAYVSAYDATPANDQPAILRAGLAVASALPCSPKSLVLQRWHADDGQISALRDLPPTPTLYLTWKSSTQKTPSSAWGWPSARLLQLVPKECSACYVRSANMSKEQVEALVYGAPLDRTAESPLKVWVAGQTQAWVNSVKGEMKRRGIYYHVSLEHWNI